MTRTLAILFSCAIAAFADPRTHMLVWDSVADAASFRVYYGTEPGVYTQAIEYPFAYAMAPETQPGSTLYWRVTAISPDGVESDLSEEAMFTHPSDKVVQLAVSIDAREALDESWVTLTNLPVLSLTNPPASQYFRSKVSITINQQ
jgi:hypothetical protein